MALSTKWPSIFLTVRKQVAVLILLQHGCCLAIGPIELVSSHLSLIPLLVLFQRVVSRNRHASCSPASRFASFLLARYILVPVRSWKAFLVNFRAGSTS